MIDFSTVKSITIPEGKVKRILSGTTVLWKGGPNNLLPKATDLDRVSIYNIIGYKTGTRLSSSGSTADKDGMCTSGFIPAVAGDVLRIDGITINTTVNCYIIAYNSSNTKTGYMQFHQSTLATLKAGMILDSTTFGSGFNAIRFCCKTITADTVVTINEEIT